jgi:hypothetical protein
MIAKKIEGQPIGIIEVPKLHDQIGSTRTSSQLRFHLRIVAAERTGRRRRCEQTSQGASTPARRPGKNHRTEELMPTEPTIARIWRGRTRPEIADDYESYLKVEGIPPLEKTALGVQLLREDREHESWFTTISYWSDLDAMTAFTKGEPTKVHHLDRDPEFLIELPESIQIHRVLINRQGLR